MRATALRLIVQPVSDLIDKGLPREYYTVKEQDGFLLKQEGETRSVISKGIDHEDA